jgi:8-oxo-dGTP pyrophosphatase MutT (NUDIX family)
LRLSLSAWQRHLREALAHRIPLLSPELNATATLAAVAVLLVPDPDAVLLIRRAERSGDPWSGHIGLPGGRPQATDADPCATAIRETREEVGIALAPAQRIGQLDDVWPRTPLSQIVVVRPFVFALPQRPPLLDSDEVAEAFWTPVSHLRDPATYREATIHLRGQDLSFPAYHLESDLVWGLTERILTPLLAL